MLIATVVVANPIQRTFRNDLGFFWHEGDPWPTAAALGHPLSIFEAALESASAADALFVQKLGARALPSYDILFDSRGVQVSKPCPHSEWRSETQQVVFCRGMDTLSVLVHEWGHAFNGQSSQLLNDGEPGALNEGLSDVWGAVAALSAAEKNSSNANASRTFQRRDEDDDGAACGTRSDRWVIRSRLGPIRDLWRPACTGGIASLQAFNCRPGQEHDNSAVLSR